MQLITGESKPTSNRPFTPQGGLAVENRIARDQQLIGTAVEELVADEHFCALVLIGGYARGEGGYVYRGGVPAPFNDYDYFLVVKGMNGRAIAALRPLLAKLAEKLSLEVGVEVDLEILRQEGLRSARPSLMFAEMLWGHKVVAGDVAILESMPPMPIEELPPGEFTRLMLNRGALLLLNQLAITTNELHTMEQRAQFIKYLFKSMLACGDARLAARGQYHPSYAEKWRRLQLLEDLPENFLHHYKLALDAKFKPDFSAFANIDLEQWQEYFVTTWRHSLGVLESVRLKQPIHHWGNYASAAVDKGQSSGDLSASLKNLAVTLRDYGPLELITNTRWSLRYPRERLISILPSLLGVEDTPLDNKLLSVLGTSAGKGEQSAENIFLGQWHRYS